MLRFAPLLAVLVLAGCTDDRADAPPPAAAATTAPESATAREAREAGAALRDVGREVGEAAGSAARDVRDATAPAMERAREAGADALDATRNGLNDLARGAACQTARGANDAAGIAANC